MNNTSEFRMELLDKLQAINPVYTFADRDNFSFVDIGFNGNDGNVSTFRIIIAELPPIFAEEEKTADKIAQYISSL